MKKLLVMQLLKNLFFINIKNKHKKDQSERIRETNSVQISDPSLVILSHFNSPDATVIRIKNAYLKEKEIFYLSTREHSLPTPSMYKNWAGKQHPHLSIRALKEFPDDAPKNLNNLFIFDTWGTSSYYHLLIDHIIPLWITAKWAEQEFNLKMHDNEYLRISDNNYNTEITTSQEIFKYFRGKTFKNDTSGIFNEIIYGYLFTYRPYHGPQSSEQVYKTYGNWLQKFRGQFCSYSTDPALQTDYILVPLRESRVFDFVDRFIQKYRHIINFRVVNFASLPIQEQIKESGSARGFFGCEGAAFANIVFMRGGSLVIPVTKEPSRLKFHERLARYVGHNFTPIILDQQNLPSVSDSGLLQLMLKNQS